MFESGRVQTFFIDFFIFNRLYKVNDTIDFER